MDAPKDVDNWFSVGVEQLVANAADMMDPG
jgi:hypothetical protein